jgi:hypothetical protein
MRSVSIAALVALAAGTVAVAQTSTPAGAPADHAARWQAHKAEFDARFADMKKRRGDDIALLIGLRADQRPAFDAMMAAMEPPHHGPDKDGPHEGPGGDSHGADESLPTRLDHMSARIDARSAAEKAKLTGLKSFYASLSPDQKLRFDALDRLRHGHDMMGRHGGGHEHGGPGGPPPMG